MVATLEAPPVVVETKTARKKKARAERLAIEERERQTRADIERLESRHRVRSCSEYWMKQMAAGKPHVPSTRCQCVKCRVKGHYGWPGTCVGSVGISFECFAEGRDLDDSPDADTLGRYTTVNGHVALNMGLYRQRKQSRRAIDTRVLNKPCELQGSGCETGMREPGERFCLACKTKLLREMRSNDYLKPA